MRGTVIEFDKLRREGRIHCLDTGNRFKFRLSNVVGRASIRIGDKVQFSPGKVDGAIQATMVMLAGASASPHPAPAARVLARIEPTAGVQARVHCAGDDTDQCVHCRKRMVPRLTTHDGYPQRSFCPFCGGIHRDFTLPPAPTVAQTVGGAILGGALTALLGSLFSF